MDVYEEVKENESPVNFFDADEKLYPRFNDIERKYSVYLH